MYYRFNSQEDPIGPDMIWEEFGVGVDLNCVHSVYFIVLTSGQRAQILKIRVDMEFQGGKHPSFN